MWAALGKLILGVLSHVLTLWLARKSGKDAQRADQAEATIDEAARANAPITDADRERVREKYRRD